MQVINSKDNEKIKFIKKLKDNKKAREENNCFLVEGIKMLKEAIQEKAQITTIVICEEYLNEKIADKNFLFEIAKYDCIYVSSGVFNILTDVIKPQGILAVIKRNEQNLINYNEDIIVVLDNIQDPRKFGNNY